jgi:hypothetical protein
MYSRPGNGFPDAASTISPLSRAPDTGNTANPPQSTANPRFISTKNPAILMIVNLTSAW